jgi:hypothetical protein
VRDRAGAIGVAAELNDQIDRARDLLADRAERQVDATHQHHRLEPQQRIAR